ncbi:acyl--CoA ligase [Christensenellaceae bacterium OttesenSCG-928-L17]|nr:acyl--CoA ligase [Christensenellaceae bacterium OttesenSCG-928-L17]
MINIDVNQSIYQAWKKNNADYFDADAMEYFGNKWTFAEVDEMITKYARAFKKMGITTSSTVSFCAPGVPAVLFGLMALNKIGARMTFVSAPVLAFNGTEYLDKPEAEILIVLDKFYPLVAESVSKTRVRKIILLSFSDNAAVVSERLPEKLRYVLSTNDYKNIKKTSPDADKMMSLREFEKLGAGDGDVREYYDPGATAVILYTGGSTGIPKGVERTNEATLSMVKVLTREELNMGDIRGLRNGIFIPPNHPTSFVHSIVAPWILGTVEVLQPFYDKNTFVRDLYSLKVGYAVGAPSHYAMFLSNDLSDGALAHLKLPFCGGESVTYELAQGINEEFERLGVANPLIVCYGMSEVGPLANMGIGDKTLVNRSGKLLPGMKGRIRKDDGKLAKPGEKGILEINTDGVGTAMKGYFSQPELTKAFWTDDGYAITGDIGVCDADGNYDMLGRATDCFVDRRGVKRYMFEIEGLIYKNDAVAEAEVSRLIVEDGATQIPVAHIVLQDEAVDKAEKVMRKIVAYLEKKLPKVMCPAGYRFVTSFPTNAVSGKRDYLAVGTIRDGFYSLDEKGKLVEIEFPEKSTAKIKLADRVVIRNK